MPGTLRVKNVFFLLLGLFFMGLGIALVTKSGLGTPPIASVSYVLSLTTLPLTFGELTFLINALFLVAEALVIGRSFPKHQYLQVFVALFFGIFVDVGMLVTGFVVPDSYAARLIVLLSGCAVLGIGIYLQVAANVIMNPGEGLVNAVAKKTGIRFGIVKIILDTTLVSTAAVISLFVFGNVVGIREGTLISMVLIGYAALLSARVSMWSGFDDWLKGDQAGSMDPVTTARDGK